VGPGRAPIRCGPVARNNSVTARPPCDGAVWPCTWMYVWVSGSPPSRHNVFHCFPFRFVSHVFRFVKISFRFVSHVDALAGYRFVSFCSVTFPNGCRFVSFHVFRFLSFRFVFGPPLRRAVPFRVVSFLSPGIAKPLIPFRFVSCYSV